MGVDHRISCGRVCTGQVGRGVNVRARKQNNILGAAPSGHFESYCDRFKHRPDFNNINIMGKLKDQKAREIRE